MGTMQLGKKSKPKGKGTPSGTFAIANCCCSGIDPIDNPSEEFKTQCCEQCVGVYGGNMQKAMSLLISQRNILVLLRLAADRKGNEYPKFFRVSSSDHRKGRQEEEGHKKEERGDLSCHPLAHKKLLLSGEVLKATMTATAGHQEQKPTATVSDRKPAAAVMNKKVPRKSAAASNGDESDEESDMKKR
eukprot:scaffold33562_cov125-Skeletonema_dohrnii-CCMP3373.AAC.3